MSYHCVYQDVFMTEAKLSLLSCNIYPFITE